MLDTIRYATISNIYVKDLKFYDENRIEDLQKMCRDWGITYLPSKDRLACYKLVKEDFIKTQLTDELICNPFDRIFDEQTLDKFEKGNHDEIMFVVEGGKIKGVVHVVDYNTEFIIFEFFKAFYQFEKMLRDLLIIKGETNNSLLEWIEIKGKKESYWEGRYKELVPDNENKRVLQEAKRRECNPFQTFLLSELLQFACSRKFVSKDFKRHTEKIKQLRNWVAHNKDLAHKGETDNHPLYRIDELKTFVKNANDFFACYEELEDLIHSTKNISNI